ncbi:hypothetical protein [Pseudonocardia zijingensis]|jgi:hypothetical protein|uniref:Integral membrane protein n=1 Tax=Pseudonocardia zijingensis TaxID=153376 RepID=A0ABN1Q6G3_9PSEU
MALDKTSNTATTDHLPERADEEQRPEEPRNPSAAPTDTATEPVTEGPAAEDHGTSISGRQGDDRAAGTADGVGPGAAAVVSAGLAVSALTGTGIGDMLRARSEIVGQIEASVSGGAVDQVEVLYGRPWDTAALVNGAVALVAVVIGGMLLAAQSGRPTTRAWVRAVALGGVVLGGIGLVVAAGMYLDLFVAAPELPQAPQLGG